MRMASQRTHTGVSPYLKLEPVRAEQIGSTICNIKGNINASGEKIYHMRGCPNYNETEIDISSGEKTFCSESEAVSAGWRKSFNCPK